VFDIGFTELLLCMVVALVVIGPEQLPGTVRTVGLWIGRMKRSLRETRSEIERQIGADDIRRQLHNEEVLQNIEEARIRFEKTILEAEKYEDADAEARRQARAHGSPTELPNHAHGTESSQVIHNTPAVAQHNEPLAVDATPPHTEPVATVKPQSGTGH